MTKRRSRLQLAAAKLLTLKEDVLAVEESLQALRQEIDHAAEFMSTPLPRSSDRLFIPRKKYSLDREKLMRIKQDVEKFVCKSHNPGWFIRAADIKHVLKKIYGHENIANIYMAAAMKDLFEVEGSRGYCTYSMPCPIAVGYEGVDFKEEEEVLEGKTALDILEEDGRMQGYS